MGIIVSMEEERERTIRENFVNGIKVGPDLRVNKNIVMFCSLSSSDNLKQHYEQRKMEVGSRAADWMKSLQEELCGIIFGPELAGIGSLAIAVLIDNTSPTTPPEKSTEEALRSVFAEEKASEVWDQIDECLKRCTMNINNKDQLKSDIKRIECQLSEALTKLKNSMVRDGHMSSPALKAWVNGAAFHIQMLIHLVRLGVIQTCDPVKNVLTTYESDLDTLFTEHKEMIKSKCRSTAIPAGRVLLSCLIDEDSQEHSIYNISEYSRYLELYYDHRYMRQKPEIQQHFREVRENLQSLVHQKGNLSVQ